MSSAVLELVCPHCRVCWMRWTIDLEKPFDKQLQKSATGEPYIDPSWELPGAVRRNSPTPGGYYQDSDGNWYRWARGEHASLPEGEIHPRQEFICPNGCRSDPQAGVHKRDKAAVRVLRELHDTRASVPFRTTVDKLLPFAK
jgi:hypothetical protein